MRRELGRCCATLREHGQQGRNGPVNLAYREAPAAAVAGNVVDARQRPQYRILDRLMRSTRVVDGELDDMLRAKRRDEFPRRTERDHFAAIDDGHAVA